MIAVIDYDAGNIMSVIKAVEALGHETVLTSDAEEILSAQKVILPGVGAFGDCMGRLEERGLPEVIRQVVQRGTPFMGICLGLQLIFDESEESPGVKGLSLLRGRVKKLPTDRGLKVPNIGWSPLSFPRESRLFKGVRDGAFCYFVHSYYLEAEDVSCVSAVIDYGTRVHAAVEHDNIFGCQFHPEKSSAVGLGILKNFLEL